VARIFVGTTDGLHQLEGDGSPGPVWHRGRSVSVLGREGWELWAVLDGRDLWHTIGAEWWFRVASLEGFRGHCVADTRAGLLVGTSEAHLFRLDGEGLQRVEGFERIDGRDGWYTPWGGPPDTRSLSEDGSAVFANVHVGGIVRSRDQGETWEPTIDVDADVHRVWACDEGVFAACARGLAVSTDQGNSWTMRDQGLHSTYCRAVAICGDAVLLSAADGPRGGHGAVYRGRIDGGGFERCRDGLPEWFDDNIDSHCLDATPELAALGTSDGRLFASTNQGATWARVASGLPKIERVLVLP
jgi:hypothetical protein